MDPEVRLAVIDVTREELERTLTPIVSQLQNTLSSIESKLEKMSDSDRKFERDNVKISVDTSTLTKKVDKIDKDVDQLKTKFEKLNNAHTGISTKMALLGGSAMIVLNIIVTLIVFFLKGVIESGLGAP